MGIEVCFGRERIPAGQVWDSDDKLYDMRAAFRAVTELAEAGYYRFLRKASCSYEFHHEERKEWLDFAEKPTAGPMKADFDLVERSLNDPNGKVIVIEPNYAQLYERLDRGEEGWCEERR
jgi:hypothetical protein